MKHFEIFQCFVKNDCAKRKHFLFIIKLLKRREILLRIMFFSNEKTLSTHEFNVSFILLLSKSEYNLSRKLFCGKKIYFNLIFYKHVKASLVLKFDF